MEDEVKREEPRWWRECECCGFETWLEEYDTEPEREPAKLCNVCASTYISSAWKYPERYGGDSGIYRSLGHLGNIVLAEQRKQFKMMMELLFAMVDPTGPLAMTPGENQVRALHAEFLEYLHQLQKKQGHKTLGG